MPPVLQSAETAALTIAPIAVPTITPGGYVRLRRTGLGLSLEDVALLVGSDPSVPTNRRVEWLASIEADVEAISLNTAITLHDAIGIDLRVLAYWMAIAEGARPSLVDVMFAAGIDLVDHRDQSQ
ncbi:helix-turn-helix transcriptional regulator [uncultured Sphingomonas sp.]|uniref:helix-turn-helix domain-containing protein n=1 Tax=uncultured Sphingomonas sp. TaxID=158754 RepID=UPI0025D74D77|nr:helix-turn-helix transcriptional regulator [uncultured Sphingomonas sp.]